MHFLHVTGYAYRRKLGTGRKCSPAPDAPGGPVCKPAQVGLCCDAHRNGAHCITLFGDGPIQSPAEGYAPEPAPTCSLLGGPDDSLSAFCCDQMDLVNTCSYTDMTARPANERCGGVSSSSRVQTERGSTAAVSVEASLQRCCT